MLVRTWQRLVIGLVFLITVNNALALLPYVNQRINQIDSSTDLSPLVSVAGQYPLVLLGEASHGTQEFYQLRAEMSQRLIEKHNYRLVAIEAPWNFVLKLNDYVKTKSTAGLSAQDLLREFDHWPQWMWRNQPTAAFIEWLKQHNQSLPEGQKVGFFGLDLYAPEEAMTGLLAFVSRYMPEAYAQTKSRLSCFQNAQYEQWSEAVENQDFSCTQQLYTLFNWITQLNQYQGGGDFDLFVAEQNARVIYAAELFYRFNHHNQTRSWNVRSLHMWHTLLALIKYHGSQTKALVWAHNTHIGDVRATPSAYAPGSITLGYLAKQQPTTFNIGFATHGGTVVASDVWGNLPQELLLPEAQVGSYEYLFSRMQTPKFYWIFNDQDRQHPWLNQAAPHRAIGVVYNPEDESKNYLPSALPHRYDALIFINKTRALSTLD